MNIYDFQKISKLLNDCPNCGNEYVGNGEGTLNVEENIFKRTCKCGFELVFDTENRKVTPKNIKQEIENSIDKLKYFKREN